MNAEFEGIPYYRTLKNGSWDKQNGNPIVFCLRQKTGVSAIDVGICSLPTPTVLAPAIENTEAVCLPFPGTDEPGSFSICKACLP